MIKRENAEIAVKDIKFTENNARTHSEEQIDLIVASLNELIGFGAAYHAGER